MPSQAAPSSSEKTTEAVSCSHDVQALLERWKHSEATLNFTADRWDMREAGGRETATVAARDVEKEQASVLRGLAELPAMSAADVVAKLALWAEITCPDGVSKANLTPAERLVLSAFEDLRQIVAVQS